jgi:uncharacterized surface protein with fasciclin (FAS1) repeats
VIFPIRLDVGSGRSSSCSGCGPALTSFGWTRRTANSHAERRLPVPSVRGGPAYVNLYAKIVATNIGASNGVIHVIDSVLIRQRLA